MISRYRSHNANLRTQLLRILDNASVTVWPRPFHNLRASRETEPANAFPIHVVCEWIGNSEEVARKHYLQVTEEHFQKATSNPTSPMHADSGTRRPAENNTAVSPGIPRDTAVIVPPRGVVRSSDSPRKTSNTNPAGAESGALDDEPDRLDRLIASLTPAELARLSERLRDRH